MDAEFIQTTQNPTLYRAMKIAVLMMELFDQKKVDDVYIVYTKMLNSMTFEPKVQQLLPLNVNNFVTSEEDVMNFSHNFLNLLLDSLYSIFISFTGRSQ